MVDQKQFREAMGTFATGVTVVTASDRQLFHKHDKELPVARCHPVDLS